jgi:pimeloyl-ACP methyl ester carboxylesterase
LALHTGHVPGERYGARATPIYLTKNVSLDGAGHALMVEQPDAVLDALRSFIVCSRDC